MIQVINRALDILEYLSKKQDSRNSLKDISTELNLNAGTCANIIKTLIKRQYIVKDLKRDYLLGSMAYSLTGNGNYKKHIITASKPELDNLTRNWNENSQLAIIEEDIRVILLRSDSINNVQANTQDHKKAYHTAIGRVLISKFSDEELKKFIQKYGLPKKEEWPEVKGNEILFKKHLATINKQGYAIILNNEQIIGFGVPVVHNGATIAGVGLYMPAFRFKKSHQNKILRDLFSASEVIATTIDNFKK